DGLGEADLGAVGERLVELGPRRRRLALPVVALGEVEPRVAAVPELQALLQRAARLAERGAVLHQLAPAIEELLGALLVVGPLLVRGLRRLRRLRRIVGVR